MSSRKSKTKSARRIARQRNRQTRYSGREVRAEAATDDFEFEGEPEAEAPLELLEFERESQPAASIKVIGVGGGGGNAIDTMIEAGLTGVEFVAANTDAQALEHNGAGVKFQLGIQTTRGLGCGADPDRGRAAALEERGRIQELLEGTDMVFVTAGMGGGTGTGAAPIVAEVAKEAGALTVGVVTKPFLFEGRVRSRHAERGIDELHQVVDTLITIPNQRLLALAGKTASMRESFRLADEVLFSAVRSISDLITIHGLINLDFADVRTIMDEMGVAFMGTGVGRGEARAVDAARAAISSPLLEDLSIEGARGVLINTTGGPDMTLHEVNEASTLVQEAAHEEANIIFGAVIQDDMPEGEMRVTVIATGLDQGQTRQRPQRSERSISNVTPLRRESEPLPEDSVRAHEQHEVPIASAPSTSHEVRPESARQLEFPDEKESKGVEDWMSPFEDELDVPTFLRRNPEEEEKENRELPAFLRRSAD